MVRPAELLAAVVTVDIIAVATYSFTFKTLPPWSPLGALFRQLTSHGSSAKPAKPAGC